MLDVHDFMERSFARFDSEREARGYDRQVATVQDIISEKVLDLDGAQENTGGGDWKAEYFDDVTVAELAKKTQDPLISKNAPLEGEILVGVMAVALLVDVTDLTLTELTEVREKLGRAMLRLYLGNDLVWELKTARLLCQTVGAQVSNDGNANYASDAQAPLTQLGQFEPMPIGWPLPRMMFLNPTTRLKCELIGYGAWTSTDDLPTHLAMHSFVARA